MLESLFNKVEAWIFWKEASTQMLSTEYRKIFKNTYFEEHLRWLFLKIVLVKFFSFNVHYTSKVITSYVVDFDLLRLYNKTLNNFIIYVC